MTHFSSEAWLDLVRNTAPAKQAEQMQQHLETGCKECSAARASWQRVRTGVRKDATFEPPADILRVVKSWSLPHLGESSRPAVLVFDSLRLAAAPGTRSLASGPHQLLYRAGSVCIDLRIEPVPGSDNVAVVGQLMDSGRPTEALAAVRISLMRGNQLIKETDTNESGEFQMELTPHGLVDLCVAQGPGEKIRLPLDLTQKQPNKRV